jgi:hypothetical protein
MNEELPILKIGDFAICHNPGSQTEHESWTGEKIIDTVARHTSGYPALHVVKVTGFKWDLFDPWGPYDGVAHYLGRETRGGKRDLEFVKVIWNSELGFYVPFDIC